MFRKVFSFGGLLLLAGAVGLAAAGSGRAAGHGGGGHFGGAHFGGAHFGVAHFGGAHFGGYRGGLYRGGYHFGYPHAYNRPYYGYRRNYPYYGLSGYYPYYGLYGYPYYGAYGYVGPGLGYTSSYYGSGGDEAPSYDNESAPVTPPAAGYESSYPPAAAQTDATAHVTAYVPADARLWFDGKLTTSTGPIRDFRSPPLTPGHQYTYDVKATWNENGHEVTQTQKVEVTAGSEVTADFPAPTKTTRPAPAVKKG
jgi:uncharacterized protein (TIGR03000 family)